MHSVQFWCVHKNLTFVAGAGDSCLESVIFAWVGCLVPVWLGDDVITGIPGGCTGGWGPCTPEFPSWGFPTQSLVCAELHVGLHVNCRLLSDFNKNGCVSTNFSVTPRYHAQ
jgi:hypothetical protein